MNRTAKRHKCKSQKRITLAKKKNLLVLCKKGLITKQQHALFDSPSVITPGGEKGHFDSNRNSNSGEDESFDFF